MGYLTEKYGDDEPTLEQKVSKILKSQNQDDDVRLTARYCNSGEDSEGGTYNPSFVPSFTSNKTKSSSKTSNLPKGKPFENAKVGDYIEGLEALGKVTKITGPNDYEKPKPPLSNKKINKMRVWLESKGFAYDGEYKGQHSYWLGNKNLSVTTDPRFIIVNWGDSSFEEEQTYTTLKSAKKDIKEILAL